MNKLCSVIFSIDCSNNHTYCFIQLCVVSIGVAYKEKVVVGLVYNPVLEDMYTTIRGQGAFCNGKKIHVTEGGISEAVINCGCTYCTDTCNMMLSNSSRFT